MSRFFWCDLSAGMEGHDKRVSALVREVVSRIFPALGMREAAADAGALKSADAFAIVSDCERLREMTEAGTLARAQPELLGRATRERLERARSRTDADYRSALAERARAKGRIERLRELAEFVVTPTV
ncbi:hypothetical protein AB4144_39215, partial [Rhizobiaceae sp. 2RAB30]